MDYVTEFSEDIEKRMNRWVREQEVEFDADDMLNICILALRWKKKLDEMQTAGR